MDMEDNIQYTRSSLDFIETKALLRRWLIHSWKEQFLFFSYMRLGPNKQVDEGQRGTEEGFYRSPTMT